MRVHEAGIRRRPPRGPHEGSEHERERDRELRTPAQVPDDTGPVGDAEVTEVRRENDLDLDAALADPPHVVGHEEAGDVPLAPGVRGREP